MQQRTAPTQPRPIPVGKPTEQVLLGRYRVLETNDEGGFGSVSICWDSLLTRRVAIKQIPLVLGDVSAQRISTVDEALGEARTASMLGHKNMVTVFDFHADERYSYIVMEYVDGLTLSELLSRVEDGVLSFDECAHLVDSLASALGFAHENRVLHLDIKPANIMIDRTGTVKLADFGMASLASAAGYGGARGGTVGYMPPEQIEGYNVDERTDIFSLAVVVWQALTGSNPFAANTAEESLKKINAGPHPNLSQIEPELAGVVEGTLLRALDPNPTGRMPTVSKFAQRLVPALGDAAEGAESLASLIGQTDEDEEPRPLKDWERLRVPLTARLPWIGSACSRLLAAATAGYLAYAAIPHILPESSKALVFGTGGIIAASAVWPPLSGALGILAIVGAFIAQMTRGSMFLAFLVSLAGLVWWLAVGRDDDLAGVALLLPGCFSSPLGGSGIAGFSLTPGRAFFTGALSWFFGALLQLTQQLGYSFDALAPALASLAQDSDTWIASLGCGVAAALCAAFARRGRVVPRMLGQVVAVITIVLFAALGAYVKNDSIVNTLDGNALGVAVFLGATLCIANALAGEDVTDGER